jgi:carboxypeptidase Taq
MNTWEELAQHFEEQQTIIQLLELISWDQETYMPTNGIQQRSKQSAFLSGLLHEKQTSPSFGELLENLSPSNPLQEVSLRNARRSFHRAQAVPKKLVEALSETKALATQCWRQAKENNDLAAFLPALSNVVDRTREYASCFEQAHLDSHLYDNLLEEYDPGMSTSFLDPMFSELEERLTPYVQEQIDTPQPEALNMLIPKDALTRINHKIIESLGFDTQAGRLDISTHPFTVGMSPNDVRLTTRNIEEDFLGTISGTIHECGHGLYEQGLPLEHSSLGLCAAAGCAIHESQSRFYENIIGQSLSFFKWLSPIVYKESGLIIPAERLYCAANRVSRTPIRIYADETTYNLHIIARYRLEKALIEQSLSVDELHDAWNEQYQKLLGITPESAQVGILQDIHWSAGLFGYFPSYTLGNLFSASYRYALEETIPTLWSDVERGNFAPIQAWLKENIHSKGHTDTQEGIVQKAVGARNHVDDLLTHLKERHTVRSTLFNKI